MPRLIAFLLIPIIVFSSPAQVWAIFASPCVQTDDRSTVITDIISDFELFTSLLEHTYFFRQYLISTSADDPESACKYLQQGFSPPLAQALTDYYLRQIPVLGKMIVIPTDSIPIITAADKPYLNISWTAPDEVVVERIYTNCYDMGDCYLYRITARKEEQRWIIVDLYLEPFPDGRRTPPQVSTATGSFYTVYLSTKKGLPI